MDIETNESKISDAYKIISFEGKKLPTQYHNLILSKFLRSLRYGNEYFNLIDKDNYFPIYSKYFQTILDRPDSVIKLAILSDDDDVVLGWSMMENKKLHYVYVNKDNRKIGIAKTLTKKPFEIITHLTAIGLSIWSSKFHNKTGPNPLNKPIVIFNPFA